MSKQFVEGNVYVFSKRKFITVEGKKEFRFRKSWIKELNGNRVKINTKTDGRCRGFMASPEWCKCIKNNN